MDITKLCRKDIEKYCAFCIYSITELTDTETLCKKKGAVSKIDTCSKFKYNPLKRKPAQRVRIRKNYNKEDLTF